jgi:hypothetical protein
VSGADTVQFQGVARPEPVPAEVLGEVLTADPANVATRVYVFAVPLDVMANLARKLTEVYERQSGLSL